MGFRKAASLYLDDAERRFASKTYRYKAFVIKSLLVHSGGDFSLSDATPQLIHSYLVCILP